jgi:predicted Zn finger-like uncharacterized protein
MIIQCEKCKTKFRLDDSRITDSGVRVRCSRCSYTFVVKRDAPEEDSDFESILQGLGGSEPGEGFAGKDFSTGTEAKAAGPVETFDSRAEEDDEEQDASFPAESAIGIDSALGALSRSDDRQESETFGVEPDMGYETTDSKPDEGNVSEESFSELLRKGAGLPQFRVSPEIDASEGAPEGQPEDEPADFSRLFDADQTPGEVAADAETEHPSPSGEATGKEASLLSSISAESDDNRSIRDHLWPVADSKDEEGGEDEMPPLSISSRRKGSPLVPILIGVLLLLGLAGGGLYLFVGNSPDVAGLVPESVRNAVGLGTKSACQVEIRSLEGVFLANKDAGEIFVIRGDVFNVSRKPLTTIQVKGKIFGAKGEVIAQRTVFCGNVLSGKQLAFQPYSSMEKVMGSRFGETLANLDVQPGKAISFMIVFKAVPKGATDYAVEVVSPVGSAAP